MVSCRLSLRKRQEMRYSQIEWGAGYETKYHVSRLDTWSGFCFLAIWMQQFSHPPSPLPVCTLSPVDIGIYMFIVGLVSFCFSVWAKSEEGRSFCRNMSVVKCKVVVLYLKIIVNKVHLHSCGAGKWHSVCEKYYCCSWGLKLSRVCSIFAHKQTNKQNPARTVNFPL